MGLPSVSASARSSGCSEATTAAEATAAEATAAVEAIAVTIVGIANPSYDDIPSRKLRSTAHMTIHLTYRTGAAFAGAIVLGAALYILPAQAIAQTSPAPAAPAAAPAATKPSKPDRVEAHIKSLHDQLKITAAQEPQWAAVAQVMRDNAATMSGLVRDRQKQEATLTAIDDLKSYQAVAEAHAADVQKLIPPFATLYAEMSDTQKKNADTVFHHQTRRAKAKKKAS
jgi:periplasmic protein CpxP/Spy